MPRMASPLSSSFIGNFTWSYIFIHHMICVLLAVLIKYQDLKFLNVRESSHSYITIQLLIDLHLYLLEQFVICSSASLISFQSTAVFYFEEIVELSCFTYIILRVLNSMVICLILICQVFKTSKNFLMSVLNTKRSLMLDDCFEIWR